jgi:hypothetical protein
MAASDFAVLPDVKTWLAGSSGIGSGDDSLISPLITDVGGAIAAYLGRPAFVTHACSKRLDGRGKTRMFLRHYPALQVASLVSDVAVAHAFVPENTSLITTSRLIARMLSCNDHRIF